MNETELIRVRKENIAAVCSSAVYCEQAHSTPSARSHPINRVTCKIMGCWPWRDPQGWSKKWPRVDDRTGSKGHPAWLYALLCCSLRALSLHKRSFHCSLPSDGAEVSREPRLAIFVILSIKLNEEIIAILACLTSQWIGLASLDSRSGWALASKMPWDESRLCCACVQRISFLVGPIKQCSTDQTPGWLPAIEP